jgi:hypothetical protein
MCVGDGRGAHFSRPAFLGILTGVAAPLLGGAAGLEDAATAAGGPAALPAPHGPLSRGNAAAAALAQASAIATATYARVVGLATTIGDAELRADVLDLVQVPRALYAGRHPSPAMRTAVRDALAREGFVAADAPVRGIFPAGTEPESSLAIQPFWSAPGSGEGSHHAYPGGLAMHESFNAAVALSLARTYDVHYFGGRPTVSRDTAIAAALYHDAMKSAVFGWNDDGTLADELTIAGTGGHHVLSGAEAIARGRDPRFVTTLLSAHAAPSLGDESKVVAWARAAAIVAGVDPVAFGLVKRDGTGFALAADPAPLEAFVNYLSDHDYVVSVHAMHVVSARLQQSWSRRPALLSLAPTFAWYRSMILTRTTALALYDVLARNGAGAFDRTLTRVESQLAPLRV